MWSGSAVRAFVSAVSCPGPPDQAAHGDDCVGEVEEGIDDGDATLVASDETVKGVLPGVGAFDVPTPTGLKGVFSPLDAMWPCRPRSLSRAWVVSARRWPVADAPAVAVERMVRVVHRPLGQKRRRIAPRVVHSAMMAARAQVPRSATGVNHRRKGTGNTLAALKSIRAARPDGAPIYVILDNLSAHEGTDIRRWAKSTRSRCASPRPTLPGPTRSRPTSDRCGSSPSPTPTTPTTLCRPGPCTPICAGATPMPATATSWPPNARNAPASAARGHPLGRTPPQNRSLTACF